MTLPVFLGPVTGVGMGDLVTLTGTEARHAVVVRRTKVGDQVVLVDGAGTSATCTVTETSKSSLSASVSDVSVLPSPTPVVTVVQAIPKGERAELAVEVLTEVGVDRIVPWAAARCVGIWRGDRAAKSLARWRATARESGKQSRRTWLPEVTGMATTGQVASMAEEADLAVVLHERAVASMSSLDLDGVRSILVVVGPEGGITDEELAQLDAAHVVRMGESVLRTSTAGVAAVAALLSRTARWSPASTAYDAPSGVAGRDHR
jgi:16S rRNA (uracil1498-N3)-methyltransferase